MKKVPYFIILILAITIGFFYWHEKAAAPSKQSQQKIANSDDTTTQNNNNKETKVENLQFPGILDDSKIANKKAIIKTNKGTVEFELYADRAPKTVSNFVYLAEQGYFDKLTFHRVVPDFVIQGGDPTGTGSGGPGYRFEDEPVVGDYKEGTVAMANAGPNTNGSQFFICLEDLPTLPKNYNLFGQVISGMDIIKNIQVGDQMEQVTIVDNK